VLPIAQYHLERESDAKVTAHKAGLVRPFLCLAAMTWKQRSHIAAGLGWPLVKSPSFGDAHKEAWEILNHPGCGVQSRANASYFKVTPRHSKVDWEQVMNRVVNAVFGSSRYVSSVAAAEGQDLTGHTEDKLRAERLANPLDARVRNMEDEVRADDELLLVLLLLYLLLWLLLRLLL